jgi:hypothetical protein
MGVVEMLKETEYNQGMSKNQVHIVFKNVSTNSTGNEFVGVFFDRKSAEDYIAECYSPFKYFIETYERPEAGMAHEVFN